MRLIPGLSVLNSTQLQLNFGDLAETGQLRFDFDHTIPETAMFNLTIGDQTVDAAGHDHIFIDVSLNGTDLLADFDIYYVFQSKSYRFKHFIQAAKLPHFECARNQPHER